jgi:hypothetical protein
MSDDYREGFVEGAKGNKDKKKKSSGSGGKKKGKK